MEKVYQLDNKAQKDQTAVASNQKNVENTGGETMPTDYTVKADKRYLNPEEELYLVGQEWHYTWYDNEVESVIRMWNGGLPLETISSRMESRPWFVMMLLVDLAESGRIKPRPGWLWGGTNG